MHVYADDTIIYSHTNFIEQAVQQKAFQSLTAKKSKCMLFLKACSQLLDPFNYFQLMVYQFLTSKFQLTNQINLLCLVSPMWTLFWADFEKTAFSYFHFNLQRDFKIRHLYI